ncbi:MAG: AMP-binding protein [Desulfobacterota bacterium]|nr:AMP-binding protein [Thermodesulfobacteriota bacterium]
MTGYLEGFTPYPQEDAEKYIRLRWWSGMTLGDLLDKAADVFPDKEAFVDGQHRLTFKEAREKTDRLAVSLLDLGVAPRDRVLIQLPNWVEFVFAYFATQKVGAIPVLLIDRYRQHEIQYLAKLSEATLWIVPEKYKKTDYLPIVEDVVKETPFLRNVILVRSEGLGLYKSMEKLMAGVELNEANLTRLALRRPDPMEVAHMGPTGGTTGLPKLVPRTHNSLICTMEFAAYAWEVSHRDTCLLAGPIGHDLTFTKGLGSTLFAFGKNVFLDTTEMKEVCETIQRERVTTIVWTPTLAKRLLDYEGRKNYDLRSLRAMHCGGSLSLPELVKGVREDLRCHFYNGYGGTEGQTTLTRTGDPLETILHTVGKPTCPYDLYKVVGPDGRELPPNTPGELVIKGPGVFTGYYKAPEENAKVFTEDGFFRTGDLAIIDERGVVRLTGRVKEMINRGGESISATEIESLISTHPDVALVAVVPMPDPDLGERVCAYIQPRPGADLSFEKIIAHLKEKKASVLQLPERIEFVDRMPLTKAEKIDKKALKEDIERKLKGDFERGGFR